MRKFIVILIITCTSCGVNEGDIVTEVRKHNRDTDVISTETDAKALVKHGTYQVGDTIHFCK